LTVEIASTWDCCWEKERHRERGREREKEGVFKSCFLDPPLYKTSFLFFSLFLNFLTCKKLQTSTRQKMKWSRTVSHINEMDNLVSSLVLHQKEIQFQFYFSFENQTQFQITWNRIDKPSSNLLHNLNSSLFKFSFFFFFSPKTLVPILVPYINETRNIVLQNYFFDSSSRSNFTKSNSISVEILLTRIEIDNSNPPNQVTTM
jgi:hypothetical protein